MSDPLGPPLRGKGVARLESSGFRIQDPKEDMDVEKPRKGQGTPREEAGEGEGAGEVLSPALSRMPLRATPQHG